MDQEREFYTLKGYQRLEADRLTTSQEDYLEMICRMLHRGERVRVSELSGRLHVRPSSASKMLGGLREEGYLAFERYGCISVTERGLAAGAYLLYRHEVVQEFLCALNGTARELELEQAEKIEHFLDCGTVQRLERLTRRIHGGMQA